jgi:hypothetical protein
MKAVLHEMDLIRVKVERTALINSSHEKKLETFSLIQLMRFHVCSDAIHLLAQSDITSLS